MDRTHAMEWAISDVTNYSAERLVKLGQYAALPSTVFSLSDRMGLVGDAFALAQAGYANVSSALGLINTMVEEKECAWSHYVKFVTETYKLPRQIMYGV